MLSRVQAGQGADNLGINADESHTWSPDAGRPGGTLQCPFTPLDDPDCPQTTNAREHGTCLSEEGLRDRQEVAYDVEIVTFQRSS